MASLSTTLGKNDAFSDKNVGGSKYLPIGHHKNVTITEAEDVELGKDNVPALKLVLSDDAGRITRTTVFYIQNVWERGQRTDKTELSWKLRQLCGSLVSKQSQRQEVFGPCYDNTRLFEGLVGFKLNVDIEYPKKGYIIQKQDNESIAVINLEEEGDDRIVASFDSFEDAKSYIEEETLPRAYTEVESFSRATTSTGEDVNAERIQNFIKAISSTSKISPRVSPLGKRTANSSM